MQLLITPTELAPHLQDEDWLVVDCRHDLADPAAGRRAYAESHIPGAVFLHLDDDLSAAKTGYNGRHPLPEPAVAAARLGQVGIRPGRRVVAYDANGGMFAARLWWMCRWLGCNEVALLDGGWPAWLENRQPVNNAPATPTPHLWQPQLQDWVVTVEHLQRHLTDWLIVDARSPDRFRGENETLDPVAGHIPGALNRWFRDNLDERGRFKPAATLATEFAALLADHPQPVLHQCGSGVTACHNLFAMELAGLPGSRLYPGSWSEWCADPRRPVVSPTP